MANILISPGKYVQGAGERKKLGTYAAAYGKKAVAEAACAPNDTLHNLPFEVTPATVAAAIKAADAFGRCCIGG